MSPPLVVEMPVVPLPLAMLVGAILLLVADTFARSIAVPAEIPVGIFTALVGAPFFLLLVRQTRGRIRGETRGQTRGQTR